jgi:type I restriction enzyme S subunit
MGRTWAASVAVQQTGQANVNGTKLQAFILPLPPLAEQHRITAEVDRLLSVADQTETAVRALLVRGGRLRQAVLARAFEGKLVPQDPNDEPASTTLEKLQHAKALAAKTRASQEPNAGTVEPASPSLPAEHKSKSPRKGPQGAPSMRPRLPKNAEKVPELRSLEAVRADDKGAMRPEALLKGAGYTAEQVDEFFGELRRLVRAGKIDEDRSPEPRLRLRGGA